VRAEQAGVGGLVDYLPGVLLVDVVLLGDGLDLVLGESGNFVLDLLLFV